VFRLLAHKIITEELVYQMIHFMRAHPDLPKLLRLLKQDSRLDKEALRAIEVWQNTHGEKEQTY
jgi:hypothetical protein